MHPDLEVAEPAVGRRAGQSSPTPSHTVPNQPHPSTCRFQTWEPQSRNHTKGTAGRWSAGTPTARETEAVRGTALGVARLGCHGQGYSQTLGSGCLSRADTSLKPLSVQKYPNLRPSATWHPEIPVLSLCVSSDNRASPQIRICLTFSSSSFICLF